MISRKYARRILFIGSSLLLSLGVFYLACCWYFSSLILSPGYDAEGIRQIGEYELNHSVEHLEIASPISGRIDFWLVKKPNAANCVIIFSHGWGEQRLKGDKFSPAFSHFNCAELRYDMRGHGRRYGETVGGGQLEKHELLALHQFLQNVKGYQENQIAWFGLSWGAATVLQAAALNAKPAFVIADSAFQDWYSAVFERGIRQYGSWVSYLSSGMNLMLKLRAGVSLEKASVLNAAANIHAPVLLIHSQTDTATDSQQSVNIAKTLAPDNVVLAHTNWGAEHGNDIGVQPEQYREMVEAFIQRYASETFILSSEPR